MSTPEDPSVPTKPPRSGYLGKAKDRFKNTADALSRLSVLSTSDNVSAEEVEKVKAQLTEGGAYITALGGWLLVTLGLGLVVWLFAIIPSIYMETQSAGSLLFLYNLAPVLPYALGLVIGVLAFANQDVFTEIAGAGVYITYGLLLVMGFIQLLGAIKFGYLWHNALTANWTAGLVIPTMDVRAVSSTLYACQNSIIIGTIATCMQVLLYIPIAVILFLISRGTTGLNHWIDVWTGMDISTKTAGIGHMIDSEFADTAQGYALITSHVHDIGNHVEKYMRHGRTHALNTYHHAPPGSLRHNPVPVYGPMQYGQIPQNLTYPPPPSSYNNGYQ